MLIVPDDKPVMAEIIPPPGPAEAVLLAMVTLRRFGRARRRKWLCPPPPQSQPDELPETVEFEMLTVAPELASPPPPRKTDDNEEPLPVALALKCRAGNTVRSVDKENTAARP
jgi:hypothetical protein